MIQADIRSIFVNFSELSVNLNQESADIRNIIHNVSSISDTLAMANISGILSKIDNIANRINNNDWSLCLLIND